MSVDRNSVSYRFIDDGKPPQAASVEVVTGVVTEYGLAGRKSGDRTIWDTSPPVEAAWPLADRIEGYRVHQGARVYRRRIIVVDDWEEVDAP